MKVIKPDIALSAIIMKDKVSIFPMSMSQEKKKTYHNCSFRKVLVTRYSCLVYIYVFVFALIYINTWYPCHLEYSSLKCEAYPSHGHEHISVLGLHWENFKGVSAPPFFSSGVNEYYNSSVVWGRWQFPNYTPDSIYD